MRRIMFSLVVICMMVTTLAISERAGYAQEAGAKETSKKEPIGLSFGLDYYSTYLWRGTYFYGKDGAFVPSISWSIFDTGLSIGVAGEFDANYFFEGDGRKAPGFDYHSVDFGVDYSHTFADLVTFGVGVWYWYYFNSEDALGSDASFLTATASLSFNVLLSPFVSLTYDYYVDEDFCDEGKNYEDVYLQFGIGHEFKLHENVALNLGLAAAFYNMRSMGEDIKGISDVTASIGLSVEAGMVTLSSGFNYVAVPMKEFYTLGGNADIHRWNATFGASVSI